MIRDKEYDPDTLRQLLVDNAVGRNTQLDTFMGLLNSIKHSTFIAIDGKWGSGKTVFVKQLEYLNLCDFGADEMPKVALRAGLSQDAIIDFQSKYLTHYYNAWQNDHHTDPLQSLLFGLIETYYSDSKKREKAKAVSKNAVKSVFIEGVKTLSKGLIDLNDITQVETIDDLVAEITTITERKQAISKIIDEIVPDDKKLLFIIDELDRCSPSFAIKLLEIIKHYYDDDRIVFVIATNNVQLTYTVKKYYGQDFDGYRYLNKFYDLVFHLPEIEPSSYISKQLKIPDDGYWKHIMPREVAKHLDFTMREINRYYSSIALVMGYLGTESHFGNNLESNLTKYVLTPYALGLKLHDIAQYQAFIKGNGAEAFRDFVSDSEVVSHFVSRTMDKTKDLREPADVAKQTYTKILKARSLPNQQENYHSKEALERFENAINLINSTSKLDEDD